MKFSEFLEAKQELVSEIETILLDILYEDYSDYFNLSEARDKIGIDTLRKNWGIDGGRVNRVSSMLNNRETGDALGVTKVHIRNVTKHVMKKLFKKMKELRPDLSVGEIFMGLADFFRISHEEEYENLYLALPDDLRSTLEKDIVKATGYKNFTNALKRDRNEDD